MRVVAKLLASPYLQIKRQTRLLSYCVSLQTNWFRKMKIAHTRGFQRQFINAILFNKYKLAGAPVFTSAFAKALFYR